MLILHFAGDAAFAEQLRRRGFGDDDIPRIQDALLAVSSVDGCVVDIPADSGDNDA